MKMMTTISPVSVESSDTDEDDDNNLTCVCGIERY